MPRAKLSGCACNCLVVGGGQLPMRRRSCGVKVCPLYWNGSWSRTARRHAVLNEFLRILEKFRECSGKCAIRCFRQRPYRSRHLRVAPLRGSGNPTAYPEMQCFKQSLGPGIGTWRLKTAPARRRRGTWRSRGTNLYCSEKGPVGTSSTAVAPQDRSKPLTSARPLEHLWRLLATIWRGRRGPACGRPAQPGSHSRRKALLPALIP